MCDTIIYDKTEEQKERVNFIQQKLDELEEVVSKIKKKKSD